MISSLALRERYREEYWRKQDPIITDRLIWRANTFRHTVHLLPAQTILELGCGDLRLTRTLLDLFHGENPITAVTFQDLMPDLSGIGSTAEVLRLPQLPGPLAGRTFDCIIAMDLLDRDTSSELLELTNQLLAPGGEMVFYESNPWNPVHKVRAAFLRLCGKPDPRSLIDRPSLYELLSEIGFIRIYAVFNDFVFAPLTKPLIWFLRNLSILLENAPMVRRMAGSILIHAQKPPRGKPRPAVSLALHDSLRGMVSVVIPCRNEAMNARPLIESLFAYYGDYICEIIPVDDGSRDQTAAVLGEIAQKDSRVKPLHRQPPNGVGRAIAEGIAAANGQFVLTMDCDFQHLLPEFRELFDAAAEGADVVIGSRFSRHSVLLNYPFTKILANRAFHTLALILFGHRLRDVTNNLKIMKREVVNDLHLRQPGFAVNAETGLEPILLGYDVRQIPISWINRTPGMGKSSFQLVQVGNGYWNVLGALWLWYVFGLGPYRGLRRQHRQGSATNMDAAVPTQARTR